MALGTVTGLLLTQHGQLRFYALVSEGVAQGRGPSSTTDELRRILYDDKTAADMLAAFAMFLFTHNASVGMLCFAAGLRRRRAALLLLFSNGLLLGAFGALYQDRGLGLEFWAWVLPHGVTELLAVVLCGAAGLVLADALLFPGRHSRRENLALRGREAGDHRDGRGLHVPAGRAHRGDLPADRPQRGRADRAGGRLGALAWTAYFTLGREPREP